MAASDGVVTVVVTTVVVVVAGGVAGAGETTTFLGFGRGATGIDATGGTSGCVAAARVEARTRAVAANTAAGRASDLEGMYPPVCLLLGPGQILSMLYLL
jgi:hypothetical protein